MKHQFGPYTFELVEEIRPESDDHGFIEYTSALRPGTRPNRYANGPFCRFRVSRAPHEPGVYAVTTANELQYLGECIDLAVRFGPRNYGAISSRKIQSDGQSTNCKVNALILKAAKAGLRVDLWFHRTLDHEAVEDELISRLRPPWNGRLKVATSLDPRPVHVEVQRVQQQRIAMTHQYVALFRRALEQEFKEALARDSSSVRIRSGGLHRKVGGYPGRHHRMPMCCAVMRSMMSASDVVVSSPPRGSGATLIVLYKLPRT